MLTVIDKILIDATKILFAGTIYSDWHPDWNVIKWILSVTQEFDFNSVSIRILLKIEKLNGQTMNCVISYLVANNFCIKTLFSVFTYATSLNEKMDIKPDENHFTKLKINVLLSLIIQILNLNEFFNHWLLNLRDLYGRSIYQLSQLSLWFLLEYWRKMLQETAS